MSDARSPVHELRLAVTVPDFDAALAFYRDALGLRQVADWTTDNGRVVVLDAGRGTIELFDERQAEYVDEVEVGRRVAGHVRVALEVDDSTATADALERTGGKRIAGPVVTPWRDRNVRLTAPDGLQLTLFTVLEGGEEPLAE